MGEYSIKDKKGISAGALGTWITFEHLKSFDNIREWTTLLVNKLESGEEYEIEYVFNYFWYAMCKLNREIINYSLKNYIKNALKNNDKEIIDIFKSQFIYEENHPWWWEFKEGLKEYPEIKYMELPF
ncbi:hypothetical protein ACN078_26090 [Clostridium diolis]